MIAIAPVSKAFAQEATMVSRQADAWFAHARLREVVGDFFVSDTGRRIAKAAVQTLPSAAAAKSVSPLTRIIEADMQERGEKRLSEKTGNPVPHVGATAHQVKMRELFDMGASATFGFILNFSFAHNVSSKAKHALRQTKEQLLSALIESPEAVSKLALEGTSALKEALFKHGPQGQTLFKELALTEMKANAKLAGVLALTNGGAVLASTLLARLVAYHQKKQPEATVKGMRMPSFVIKPVPAEAPAFAAAAPLPAASSSVSGSLFPLPTLSAAKSVSFNPSPPPAALAIAPLSATAR